MNQNFVIIVAAGTGSRMNSTLPKQFMELAGMPVLMHTIRQFAEAGIHPEILVVLSESMLDYWQNLVQEQGFSYPHAVCSGGDTRFQSVKAGISYLQENYTIQDDAKIAIHDAARPIISDSLINSLFETCNSQHPAVIPAVQSSSSVRLGDASNNEAIDRDQVWLVQTPQVFLAGLLSEAYKQAEDPLFTDDASVIEKMSNSIFIHPGDPKNIKITFNEDIAIAQYYLTSSIQNR